MVFKNPQALSLMSPLKVTHQNQQIAGNEIVNWYQSGQTRYCLLTAEMQSGKTGTYNWVIKHLVERKMVEHVVVLCGSNDKGLSTQTWEEMEQYLAPDVLAKCSVFFRNVFERDLEAIRLDQSLIIIDESHLDQSKNQQMDQLLTRYNLRLDGDLESLRRIGSYILSVSATPFSEYVNWLRGSSHQTKKVVTLIPDASYKGVKHFNQMGQIRENFLIRNNVDQFVELVRSYGNKYNIIRIVSSQQDVIRTLCDANGFDCYTYDADSTKPSIFLGNKDRKWYNGLATDPCMAKPAERPTIVMIKGRLRVGKNLEFKKHIGFLWENSEKPNADAILQGLLGRGCGYPDEHDDNSHLVFYISPLLLEPRSVNNSTLLSEIERYYTPSTVPTCGNNLIKPKTKSFYTTTAPTTPLRIRVGIHRDPQDDDQYGTYQLLFDPKQSGMGNRFQQIRWVLDWLRSHPAALRQQIDSNQIDEVNALIEQLGARQPNGRNDFSTVTVRYFKQVNNKSQYATSPAILAQHFVNKTPINEHCSALQVYVKTVVAGEEEDHSRNQDHAETRLAICIVQDLYSASIDECKSGDIFVVFYTNSRARLSHMPETTGHEIFKTIGDDERTVSTIAEEPIAPTAPFEIRLQFTEDEKLSTESFRIKVTEAIRMLAQVASKPSCYKLFHNVGLSSDLFTDDVFHRMVQGWQQLDPTIEKIEMKTRRTAKRVVVSSFHVCYPKTKLKRKRTLISV